MNKRQLILAKFIVTRMLREGANPNSDEIKTMLDEIKRTMDFKIPEPTEETPFGVLSTVATLVKGSGVAKDIFRDTLAKGDSQAASSFVDTAIGAARKDLAKIKEQTDSYLNFIKVYTLAIESDSDKVSDSKKRELKPKLEATQRQLLDFQKTYTDKANTYNPLQKLNGASLVELYKKLSDEQKASLINTTWYDPFGR